MGGLVLTIYIVLPVYFACLLRRMDEKLALPETKERIGALFEGLNTAKASSAAKRPRTWLYSSLFLARRGLFAALTVFMLQHPNLQIILHLVLSLVFVVALLARG